MCKEKLSIKIAKAIQKEEDKEGRKKEVKRTQAIWSILTLGGVYSMS